MGKNLLCYVALFLVFGTGTYLALEFGARLKPAESVSEKRAEPSADAPAPPPGREALPPGPVRALGVNLQHPLTVLLLQLVVIITAARLCGNLSIKAGQPPVVGEMAAGLLLGPSFLGAFFPEVQKFLFPPSSMDFLHLLGQIGVIVFMFIVGAELNLQHLRQKAHAAVLVSHASILAPFFLGVAFSLLIYPSMAPANVPFSAFAMFIGVAMSITAFPVLARIVEERGLRGTHLGNTTIACAAVDDVTAWCALAVVVAIVKSEGLCGSLTTVLLTSLFIGTMLFLLKPRVERLAARRPGEGMGGQGQAAWWLCLMLASALCTEIIGIHALFGAFLAGVTISSHAGLRSFLRERLETYTSVFLLPLFFAYTGLRTQLGLLGDWQGWLVCLGIIGTAVAGKLGASMLAARWTGMSWRDSFSVGALMNTRGLIELIVLNLGYDLGILSPRVFAMMVLMALTTTFMTGLLLSLAEPRGRGRSVVMAETTLAA